MKKIIDRIVLGSGSPNQNDLWLDDRNGGLEIKVHDEGEWKSVSGGSGGGGGVSEKELRKLKNFYNFALRPDVWGDFVGIIVYKIENTADYYTDYETGVGVAPKDGDYVQLYKFEDYSEEEFLQILDSYSDDDSGRNIMLANSNEISARQETEYLCYAPYEVGSQSVHTDNKTFNVVNFGGVSYEIPHGFLIDGVTYYWHIYDGD